MDSYWNTKQNRPPTAPPCEMCHEKAEFIQAQRAAQQKQCDSDEQQDTGNEDQPEWQKQIDVTGMIPEYMNFHHDGKFWVGWREALKYMDYETARVSKGDACLGGRNCILIIYVEGNICAGKSTLLRELAEQLPYAHFVPEPDEGFTNYAGQFNLPEMCRSDKESWALLAQLGISEQMVWRDLQAIDAAKRLNKRIIIAERSVGSGRHVFAAANFPQHDPTQLIFYNEFMHNLCKLSASSSHAVNNCLYTGTLYLRVSPIVCFNRLKKKMPDTQPTTLDYLKKLDVCHELWYKQQRCNNNPSHLGHLLSVPQGLVRAEGWGDRKMVKKDLQHALNTMCYNFVISVDHF